MSPKDYRPFIDYSKIDEEELRQIIKEATAELEDRGTKLFERLKGNIVKALEEMREYFPECEMMIYSDCRRCGEEYGVDVLAFNEVEEIEFRR